jgi:hypothetical protein
MLEDLDKIAWDELTHAYGSAADVPDLMRAMVQQTERDAFYDAWGEFANTVNHQGSIYAATPYTVPFLLDLINDSQIPTFQRVCYLFDLASYVEGTQVVHGTPSDERLSPITGYRLNLQLYDAVSAGLNTYLAQLASPEVGVRGTAVYLLARLPDQHARVLPRLEEAHTREADEVVRSGIIWGYALLAASGLPSILQSDQRRDHQQRLLAWAQAPISRPERIAAAVGCIHTALFPRQDVPPILPELLASAAQDPVARPDPDEENPFSSFEDFLPYHYLTEEITGFCRRMYGPDLWIDVIRQTHLPPLKAHPLIRELLNVTFDRYRFDEPWLNLDWFSEERPPEAMIYQIPEPSRYYVPGKPLNPFQKQALKLVVEYDSFWEIPTNLFEFFYGLPNSREELRRLAE